MVGIFLSARNMSKRFEGLRAVDEVSFDVVPDKFLALPGQMGTTLDNFNFAHGAFIA